MNIPLTDLLREAPLMLAAIDSTLACRELSPTWRDLRALGRERPVAIPVAELFDAGDQIRASAQMRLVVQEGRAVRGLTAALSTDARPLHARLWGWRVQHSGEEPWMLLAAVETGRAAGVTGDSARMRSVHQQILEAAGDGICGVDDLGLTTFMNAAAANILGSRPEEVLGQPLHDVHQHSRSDGSAYPRDLSPLRMAYKDGHTQRVREDVFWRPDGAAVPVEYVTTPIWNRDRLGGAVVVFRDISGDKAVEQEREDAYREIEQLRGTLELERDTLRTRFAVPSGSRQVIGASLQLKRTLAQIEAAAVTTSNVLVVGERGTGKKMAAREIHTRSSAEPGAFLAINCATVPPELFDTECFGLGRRRASNGVAPSPPANLTPTGGTLFLERPADLARALQERLLDMLDECQGPPRASDSGGLRVITAAEPDLPDAVASGRFLEALYYRLSVFRVEVPALRDRKDDLLTLARHFLDQLSEELGRQPPRLTRQHTALLSSYAWPGNVRELRNVIERALILADPSGLRLDLAMPTAPQTRAAQPETPLEIPDDIRTDAEIRRVEKANMLAALRECGGRVSGPDGAAAMLGLKPSTMAYRMKAFDISRADVRTRGRA